MGKKTITVNDKTWQELTKLKAELMNSDLDKTINYLLYNLMEEDQETKAVANGKSNGAEDGERLASSPSSYSNEVENE